jgi:TRAP-type C4-dicarboxylate transport system substrate-binding protein
MLTALLLLGLAWAPPPPPARAAAPGKTQLKIATLVPEGSVWDKSLRGLEQEAKDATGGSLSFRIYPGGVAGDESDILRKIRIGQLHGGVLSIAGLGEIDSAVQVFQIPLYLRSDEEALYVLEHMDALFRQRLAERGYVLVHWAHAGWLDFFSTEPVRTAEDLKSLKQFVWAGDTGLSRWYEEAGLRAVPLAATDVLTGLKTGLIECLPSTPLAALSLQWFRSAGHMLDYPVSPLYGGLVVSKRAWDGLDEDQRAALLAAGRRAQAFQMEEIPRMEAEAIAAMRERGLVVTEPEPARDAPGWLALSDHFARRMLEAWAPPEVLRQVEGHLAEFRARGDAPAGAERGRAPRERTGSGGEGR